MVSDFCKDNKEEVEILDVGCESGHVGKYLRQDGFRNIDGMDGCQRMLNIAEESKAYNELHEI